ncbi:SDR family NAD(P)-dependent oxidoreductase [Sphingomonas sp.]|uniref:SDR family NAD(P)-dependent oxidoreductase n=1 Tax=Sphingomonas sp. TaxID=28214 RepID=UPI002DD69308|nr:SDR family oxidoreductase [Sphingomonas sp.]
MTEVRRALVTGAARGIGLAIAERLAEEGWQVVATDRDVTPLAGVVRAGITPAPLDVTDRPAVAALLDGMDTIDLAVCNAGISGRIGPPGTLPPGAFAEVLRVNLLGVFITAQEAARRMMAGSAIVTVASRSHLSSANAVHYGMSKGAVVALTRAMASAWRWRGISVNAVSPGLTDTDILRSLGDDHVARMASLEPGGAPLDPAVMAGAVAWLASPEGRHVRGQNLLVDDGKSIGMTPW